MENALICTLFHVIKCNTVLREICDCMWRAVCKMHYAVWLGLGLGKGWHSGQGQS